MSENDNPNSDSQENIGSQPNPLPDDVLPEPEPTSQINFKADFSSEKNSSTEDKK